MVNDVLVHTSNLVERPVFLLQSILKSDDYSVFVQRLIGIAWIGGAYTFRDAFAKLSNRLLLNSTTHLEHLALLRHSPT